MRTTRAFLAACLLSCGRPPPELDRTTVTVNSHAFLEAFDRGDSKDIEPLLGRSFQRFERGRTKDRALVLKELASATPSKRAWGEEHVSLGDGTATFIGEAVETFPVQGDRPAMSVDFWNTIVWVREGERWKVAHWQVEEAPSPRDEWNETYRRSIGFTREPNALLVQTVKGRKPGTALDVGMGQGRNAVFLATQGWKVTGVDISDEGLRLAKAEAAKRHVDIETVEAELATWDLGREKWDLVVFVYAGADPKDVERIKTSLRPGGLVVVEVFHADGTGGTRSGGFATGQLARLFGDTFTIVRDETVDDVADWGGPSKTKLVRFVATKN
jgi:SAM-dependent methyltransferase